MTALEREWAAKLAASGFRDLEGRDRDGPLSDRGNLHVVTEGDGQRARLADRIEHGSAYHTWALDILRTHRFRSALERRAWASHADGVGILDTARKLGVTFHWTRNALQSIRQDVRQGREGSWRKPKIKHLVRRADPATLLRLASVLLKARPA